MLLAYESQLQSERKAYNAFTSITSQDSSQLPGQHALRGAQRGEEEEMGLMRQCRHQGEVVERWRRRGGGGEGEFKIKIWGGD